MKTFNTQIKVNKKIALVAHDHKKKGMVEWAKKNIDVLKNHEIFATGTTGKILEEALGIKVNRFLSGPLGGDQQIGAAIVTGGIDFLVFFWDPLEPQPHDPDVKALLRIAVVWDIPFACNRASADFLLTSYLMDKNYDRKVEGYEAYINRPIE